MTKKPQQHRWAALLAALAAAAVLVLPGSSGAAPLGAIWVHFALAQPPPAREGAAMAYDGASGQVVMFGGTSASGGLLGDTWLWDGGAWHQAQPVQSPPPLEGASMAYDPILRQLILFGGVTSNTSAAASDVTWAWNGATWYQITPIADGVPPTLPPARSGASLAPTGEAGFVLFGGMAPDGAVLGDTWTFDGLTWTRQRPAASPPPRTGAGATWDPTISRAVIFGGQSSPGGGWRGDTWTWTGTTWAPVPGPGPAARSGTSFSYDADLGGDVAFAGQAAAGLQSDAWLFDGTRWAPIPTTDPPSPRSLAGAAWDSGTHQLMIFGGAAGGGEVYGDTSALGRAPGAPSAPTTTRAVPHPAPPTPTATTPAPKAPAPSGTALTKPSRSAPTPPTAGRRPSSPHRSAVAVTPLITSPQTVHPGQKVTLSGSGFAHGAVVSLWFRSTDVNLGSARADSAGDFKALITVPAHAVAGTHHFEARGMVDTGSVLTLATAVRVVSPSPDRGRPHSETVAMVGLALLIPLITWLVLVMLSRRRRA